MSHRARRYDSNLTASLLTLLASLALPRIGIAQQLGEMTVSVRQVLGTGGTCSATAKPLTIPAGAVPFDTVIVRVVDDTAANPPTPPPRRLVLLRDGIPVDSTSIDTLRHAEISRPSAITSYRLRVSGGNEICRLALDATAPQPPDTSVAAREATADSLAREAAHRRASENGNSFVILSLIKSISGEIPRDEFFDIRMKFGGTSRHYNRLAADSARREANALRAAANRASDTYAITGNTADSGKSHRANVLAKTAEMRADRMAKSFDHGLSRIFSFASLDVALSQRVDTGTADAITNRRLTDAQLSLNYILVAPSLRSTIPDRIGYAGALFKVFDTRSFLGFQYGGLELRGSRLEGTSVNVALLRRLYPDSVLVKAGTPADTVANTPATEPQYAQLYNRNYAYIEFYIRVPRAQFLDRLRVRGGLLMPLGSGTREPLTYRVTLTVPIVDLTRF